jgi:SAM-dependent methyltransferase
MIFQDYSKFYNLLYSDKDYKKESEYILSKIEEFIPIKYELISLLDIGCGTGKHLKYLTPKLNKAVGIDPSKSMIKIAKIENNNESINFKIASAQNLQLNTKFDVIVSLFHVFSYQTNPTDLNLYLSNIYNHLKPNGLFIFDFWFEDAVIFQNPETRVKKIEDSNFKITRISTPKHEKNNKTVDVIFDIFVQNKLKNNKIKYMCETHKMKYFNTNNVEKLLNNYGYTVLKFEELITGNLPNKDTWGVCCIAKK